VAKCPTFLDTLVLMKPNSASGLRSEFATAARCSNLGGALTGKNREALMHGGSLWTPVSLDTNVANLVN
jgi:hypothetical protein